MIYVLLFWEFFQIGLFAVGGGLATVPFLFDLSEKYAWFSTQELADMIAVSQSTPGPVGINMATYAGFNAAGISGALVATFSEVLPAVVIIYFVARMLEKWKQNSYLQDLLRGIRPAIVALILFAGWDIAKLSITDVKSAAFGAILLLFMRCYKISAIYYILAAAIFGIVLQV